MSYSTCIMVAALIPNILDGASNLTDLGAKIRPASSEIRRFMSGGGSLIAAKISSMGFVPAGSAGALGDFLGDIESNYAAWRSETSRSSPRTNKGERSRASVFRKAYEAGLRQVGKMDLEAVGFTPMSAAGGWYIGGISESEKASVASNTDRVKPAFTRGGFSNPEADAVDDQT